MEAIAKGELVGEYMGEVITQEEAERRGRHYDRQGMSYLFNLNRSQVIDATRYGTKTKFMNHSFDPNCRVQVTVVNGDHRIAILAKQNLPAGSEICFDYGYGEDVAPQWAQGHRRRVERSQRR